MTIIDAGCSMLDIGAVTQSLEYSLRNIFGRYMRADLRTLPPSKRVSLDSQKRLINMQVLQYDVDGDTHYCLSAQDLMEAGLAHCTKSSGDDSIQLHEQYMTDPKARVHTLDRCPYEVDYEEVIPLLLATVQTLAKDMRDQVQLLRRACLPVKKIRIKDANGQFHWVKKIDDEFEQATFMFD